MQQEYTESEDHSMD